MNKQIIWKEWNKRPIRTFSSISMAQLNLWLIFQDFTWIGIILSLGAILAAPSGSRLELRLACGTTAATGKATSDLWVRSFCGWKASIFASTSLLNAALSGDFIPERVISALLVLRCLGKVALFNVISILLDTVGSSVYELSKLWDSGEFGTWKKVVHF